jgi:bacillolysin
VVAHELTHGVTTFSSGLVYFEESGALNEAFSDIMACAMQFHFRTKSANYFIGDDVIVPAGIRSMIYPFAFGDPDHYSIRYRGFDDNGGVHINCSIATHAYYLAVEGGTHRLSRVRVEGVGAGQREKIDKVFFRAFTRMLTPFSGFSDARAATIQSARDIFGPSDPSVRALTEAWDAVGVS